MSILDSLVNVSISISSPVAQVASFSTLLIIADAAPDSVPTGITLPDVGRYTSLNEVASKGWVSTDPTYLTAATAFGNGATEIYIAVPKEDSGTGEYEDISATFARALEYDGWYGFVLAGDYSTVSAKYSSAATLALGNHKLFGFVADWSGSSPTSPITDNIYCYGFGTKNLSVDGSNAINIATAIMAKAFSYDAGAETWAYKTLTGVAPDTFTPSEIDALKEANLNYYITCAGRNITLDGRTTEGEWIDIIRFRDWLLNNIQGKIYTLFIVNPKVPYTDDGLNLIFGQLSAALTEGQQRGGIATADFDELGNVTPGYTITMPTMASIPESIRATRSLTGVKFSARLTGAIHIVTITGVLVQ